jgi:phage baseplate assembly protein W
MKTFIGNYNEKNFVYANDIESIRAQLISILNTPFGSRFYYPTYGSNLNKFRFSILNYFTINMIGQEIKNAIALLGGVTLSNISYYVTNNQLYFNIVLNRQSEKISLNLKISDGIAS